jgi:predicted transcriptional regulator
MRTTVRLDEALLAEAKQVAARTGRTLNAVIEDALRQALAQSRRPASRTPVELTTFRGEGLQPGIDLDDSAALLDAMETGG